MKALLAPIIAIAVLGCGKPKESAATLSSSDMKAPTAPEEPGIGSDFVRVGTTGPYDGTLAAISTESYRGASAYFAEVNAQGGVHGRKIDLLARSDAYDPAKAAENVRTLIAKDKVFCLMGGFGTEPLAAVTNVLLEQKASGVFGFGTYNGAEITRTGPGFDVWYNVTASFKEEAEAMAAALQSAGFTRVALFRQDDAFGQAALDAIRAAFATHRITLAADTKHPRATTFDRATGEQVRAIKAANADAVVAFTVYQPAAAFVRDARDAGFDGPIVTASMASDAMLPFLTSAAPTAAKSRYFTRPLMSVSVVPNWQDDRSPLVLEFRSLLDRRTPAVSRNASNSGRESAPYQTATLHGYLTAKIFAEVLERTGPKLTRAAFRATVERMTDYDPGLGGARVAFSPKRHQALERVFTAGVRDGKWISLADPAPFLRGEAATAPTVRPGSAPQANAGRKGPLAPSGAMPAN